MSESENRSGTPGNREVAHRLFAAEYDDATYSYSESDEERAPNYVVTPTGARVNRLFAVGVLTEVGQAGETMLRARVADPTGAFVIYAGQYQPDAMAFLDNAEPPAFVAVTGKARTFQPEDSDQVFTSVRPEEISEVDSETRDRWTVTTAERTLERVATVATALNTGQTGDELRDTLREKGVDPSFAAGIPIALEQYDTTRAYLADVQRLALDAIRIVADEIDAVDDLVLAPDEGDGSGSIEPAIDTMSISTPLTTDTDTPDTSEQSAMTSPSSSPVSADETTTTAQRQESETETESAPTEETTADQTEPTLTEHTQPDSTRTESDEESSASTESSPETSDEFDPEEFELDEEVRQEVESEYGTEFSTASEVDSPGEAAVEMNDSDDEVSSETEGEPSFDDMTFESDTTTEPGSESESEPEEQLAVDEPTTTADNTPTETDTGTETGTDTETDIDTEPATAAEDVNLEAVLLETMDDLNDGDGADHETLVEQVSEAAGVSDDAVDDAIQEALMSGQCYEPNDGKLKPI
jgi:RPA family protein